MRTICTPWLKITNRSVEPSHYHEGDNEVFSDSEYQEIIGYLFDNIYRSDIVTMEGCTSTLGGWPSIRRLNRKLTICQYIIILMSF